ncbi:MAG: hypothetical protein HC902_07610 [Calothrix sp. SM1_5_4]|nr:hypothetical protein [Calothrix sp. SM1_5_4]
MSIYENEIYDKYKNLFPTEEVAKELYKECKGMEIGRYHELMHHLQLAWVRLAIKK